MSKDIEAVIERALEEVCKEFDGLYVGWFTPDELDLVLEALTHYGQKCMTLCRGHHCAEKDPDKAKQVSDLLKAMNELKEEGGLVK